MRNIQPPEKLAKSSPEVLSVHSVFHTIQGEGPFAGQPAVFIRLAGCNLQCPGCDTDYTTTRKAFNVVALVLEVTRIRGITTNLVVITGGEPFRQPLGNLVTALLREGYRVQLETNGSFYQDLPYDQITVVCSPKTGTINRQLEPHLAALKYVLDAKDLGEDGLPERALDHGTTRLARPTAAFKGTIYVQPYDPGGTLSNDIHHQAAVQSCLSHGYTLCLQMHKFLGLE